MNEEQGYTEWLLPDPDVCMYKDHFGDVCGRVPEAYYIRAQAWRCVEHRGEHT